MATNLRVTELDFDQIKNNIKEYLKGQPEFTDYDFEGSGLSVLIDTLAYNTHYNAFYINMAMNEIFIDSAVKRESVVSLSKMLNYVPRSSRAAIAKLNILVNDPVATYFSSVLIDRYTPFTTSIDGVTYNFYNIDPVSIIPVGGVYSYNNLEVFEGTYIVTKFNVVTPGPAEKFIIPNKNIDLTTLRVTVQNNPTSDISNKFTQFDGDITGINSESKIFYIEQNPSGYYQIYFGDGILGTKLLAGQQVTTEYLVTNGSAANVSDKIAQEFTLATTLMGITDVTITVSEKSNGGIEEETIDEIRFNAPKYATTQNRLITSNDYSAFLKSKYNYIDSVAVWGGEDNVPPQFGKVMISILPKPNQILTTSRKSTIVSDIKSKRSMSIVPEFVEPDVFYINVQSIIKYNPNVTNDTSQDIETAVKIAIQSYFQTNIVSFGDTFSTSKLSSAIDASKSSILGNGTTPIIQKRLSPILGSALAQSFRLSTKIEEHTVTSTRFYCTNPNDPTKIIPVIIKDVPIDSPVKLKATYRRSGAIVTVTTETPHDFTVGEVVNISFSGVAIDGAYQITTVTSDTIFTLVTVETGSDFGTAEITAELRGTLKLFNALDNTLTNTDIGYVSYLTGTVLINNLVVLGFLEDQTDLRIYFKPPRDSEDIFVQRNQIIRLDDSNVNEATNRLAGISISSQPIAK